MTVLWTAPDIRDALGGMLSGGPDELAATGVSIDTRTLVPGDLFVALRGEHGHGDAFVADALANGAAGAIAETAGAAFRVSDTLAALTALGRHARDRSGARRAAITGSVGKTTTKEMLRRILAAAGPTHAAIASYNNHWGVPLTLARMPRDAAFCVLEVGTNHPGEIAPLASLARPHVAVITTIEAVHIGQFAGVAAIADEKGALLGAIVPDGVAVLPADSPYFGRLRALAGMARVVTFGTAGDVRPQSAELDADGTTLTAAIGAERATLRLGAPGQHMVQAALAALAAAHALGIAAKDAAGALDGFAPLAGRGARRAIAVRGGTALLLDESYNASPVSVRAALAVLALQPGRRVAVLGDMLELGDMAGDAHAGLAGDVAAGADVLFACGPNMRALFDAVPHGLRGGYAAEAAALAPIVAEAAAAGDAVLVKGSLGSFMSRIVAALDHV